MNNSVLSEVLNFCDRRPVFVGFLAVLVAVVVCLYGSNVVKLVEAGKIDSIRLGPEINFRK